MPAAHISGLGWRWLRRPDRPTGRDGVLGCPPPGRTPLPASTHWCGRRVPP